MRPATFRRLHLFEFNDSHWAPESLRDTVVEALSRSLRWGGITRELVPAIEAFLDESGSEELLDMCAGAGGPALAMYEVMSERSATPIRIVMSDLFPRPEAWAELKRVTGGHIDYVAEPADATALPPAVSRGRARLVLNAFHHFPPELGREILADAVRCRAPVMISEAFERTLKGFLPIVPVGLLALAATPWASPKQRAQKALWIYGTPIAALVSAWDGFVSTMRVYSEQELRDMAEPLSDSYRWTYGHYHYALGGRGYYFYGIPASGDEGK